jgi:DNA-binding winged helix-turn-helix (wHTH) protein/tetratricopeptide (TPR) repeat protein
MKPAWRFAEFELDPDNQLLRRSGSVVKLTPQPFKMLLLLVSRRGALVRREELQQAVWGGVAVDFEHGLNTAMRQVRTALGDDADAPRIIETVPRVGYRLKVPVKPPAVGGRRMVWGVTAAVVALMAAAACVVAFRTRSEWNAPRGPLEAHALYIRGLLSLERGTEVGTTLARRLFSEAAQQDPASARLQVAPALTYLTHPVALAGVGPREGRARAAEAITRAASRDPTAPEVGRAEAELKLAAGDWTGADIAFRRSIERTPADPSVHEAYAVALTLRGRLDDALREARRAQDLDPLSPHVESTVASTLRFARRYDEAMAVAEDVLRLDPTYGPAFHTLGLCYEAKGQFDRAIESYLREGRPSGNLAHAYALAGRTGEARRLLAQFEERYANTGSNAGEIAQVYFGLREYDHAFEWLQRNIDAGGQATTLRVAEVWDPLRADPRFEKMLAKLGLGDSGSK